MSAGHLAAVGRHADQHRVAAESRAAEFADIEFATPAHRGRRGIADVRVVRPDHCLGIRAAMIEQGTQRIEHVPVAQIPDSVEPRYIAR